MRRTMLSVLVLALLVPAAAAAKRHPRMVFYGHARTFHGATAYCSGSQTASGHAPRAGTVAVMPGDPWDSFGTRFMVTHVNGRFGASVVGRRFFSVWDHIGAWSELDFWAEGQSEASDCGGFARKDIRARRYRWVVR